MSEEESLQLLGDCSSYVLMLNNRSTRNKGLPMSKKSHQTGLDNRHRDLNGEIRQKNSNTRIDTLRQIYGGDFAKEYRGDMSLGTLLDRTGVRSLSEYLKRQ